MARPAWTCAAYRPERGELHAEAEGHDVDLVLVLGVDALAGDPFENPKVNPHVALHSLLRLAFSGLPPVRSGVC